ncbi:MAG TPA: F0F1 ATP synthase subunit B [Longimicrobiales bacterium]|nr:F0F1 ATP synthase subunit B [Longimicrobiales bacterium]
MLTTALVFAAASPAALWAQEHGAEGGGEGGLFDINVGLSMWTLLVFAGLVFILGRFAWGPILGAVEAREKAIQGAIDEAARRNAEAAGLLEEHRKQLGDARRQASELIAEGKSAGERVRKEIEEKARSEAQAIVDRAKQEIQRERDAALDMMRKESVDLALAAASHLIRENLDDAEDRQLVERFLSEMDSGSGAQA